MTDILAVPTISCPALVSLFIENTPVPVMVPFVNVLVPVFCMKKFAPELARFVRFVRVNASDEVDKPGREAR